jgi:adenylate kinase family enzyme
MTTRKPSGYACRSTPSKPSHSDDNEETIRVRLRVYAEQTEPLLEVYRSRGLLVEVDGLGEIDEVSERVFAALDAHRERRTTDLVEPA